MVHGKKEKIDQFICKGRYLNRSFRVVYQISPLLRRLKTISCNPFPQVILFLLDSDMGDNLLFQTTYLSPVTSQISSILTGFGFTGSPV